MIVWLLSLALILWVTLFRFRRRRMYQLASLIRAPKSELPVIGIMHNLSGSTEDIMLSLQQFSYDAMNNNGIIKGWLNHILYLLMVNPVDLEVILKTCMEKDDLHRFIRTIIGYGGIFAPVPIWKRRRKILIPTFTPKIVENFFEVFNEQSDKLVEVLSPRVETGKFSLWPYLSAYTLDSVCETTMGVKINAQNCSDSSFLLSMNKVLHIVCKRIFHLWLQPDWLFKLFKDYTEHEKHKDVLHTFIDDVIRNKQLELVQERKCRPEVDNNFGLESYSKKSFLELLLTMSSTDKGLNNIELREEILTLTLAGTDTSAVAIGYTLKLLSKYPKVQDKLYSELLEILGQNDRAMTRHDLKNLKYLDMVVKESLRLFPPVPFVIRKVETEIKLPSGVVLPAGSGVVVSIWGAHRDPKYWGPDAECFDPERFLPERYNLEHACSYMPFSNGPRNCLGFQYALMSIKTTVAKIIKNYKVIGEEESSPVPHIRVKLDVMMKAIDGYEVALERRRN